MKSKETDLAFYKYEDNILYVKAKSGYILDKPDMERMLVDAIELTEKNKYYAIIDTSEQTDSTPESRKYYSKSEFSKYRYADAFIVDSIALRLVVNFYLKFSAPPVPSKMFSTIEQAKQWIKELKAQNALQIK